MWWNVGTLGLVAEIAEVAVFYHLAVIRLVDAVNFQGRRFVDQIEQRRKRLTQADAAAAAVADVKTRSSSSSIALAS
jgi:hypothetical protein